MWIFGATLVVLGLLLPDSSVVEEPGLALVGAIAAAFAATMWFGAGRVPRWAFDAAIAGGTVILAILIAATGGAQSPFLLLMAWQLVFAGYFLPPTRAGAQVAVAALAMTVAFLAHGGDFAPTRWAVGVTTFVVIGALVVTLRRHVDELLGAVELSARTDALTGVLNRGGFDEVLRAEERRVRRTGRPLSLVMCDIDHFKAVNDRLGHPAGDAVLRRVATALRGAVRDVDTVGRRGGEEFAVVLPETGGPEAFAVAERMRKAVRDSGSHGGLAVTGSFGVAVRHPGRELAADADRALYHAKSGGRDRTVLDAPPTPAHDEPGRPARVPG